MGGDVASADVSSNVSRKAIQKPKNSHPQYEKMWILYIFKGADLYFSTSAKIKYHFKGAKRGVLVFPGSLFNLNCDLFNDFISTSHGSASKMKIFQVKDPRHYSTLLQ